MNSRVSWSVDGIDPTVRERAESAARRAGMSLNDWLNSTLGDAAPPNARAHYEPRQQFVSQESPDVADIHQRLDAITRHIEQISRPAPRNDVSREQGVARQLNEAISRLDARLSQISSPQAARAHPVEARQRHADSMVERAAAQVYRNAPPLAPASLDVAVAEIPARHNEPDSPPPRQMPMRAAPQVAPPPAPPPPAPGPDFSSL